MTAVAQGGRWADLVPRILSAIVMLVVGGVELWLGGRFFHVFVGLVVALMLWELVRMLAPFRRKTAVFSALAGGLLTAIVLEFTVPNLLPAAFVLFAVLGCAVGLAVGERRNMGIPYAILILFGGLSLMLVRDNLGLTWIIWLVGIVVASDIAGYFAGKAIGGPKFWPSISPKKTWSGTIAGWLAAAGVGLVFVGFTGPWVGMLMLSLLLAFAAQMGDIAESAIKRRTGVKDSSGLIPGHGGVLDRFDGLIGASAALLVIAMITGMPEGLL